MLKVEQVIEEKFNSISFCLNERSRRIWAASEAKSYGWGGVTAVCNATGISKTTIKTGLSPNNKIG